MTHPFPEETVKRVYGDVSETLQKCPGYTKFSWLRIYMQNYNYGFYGNLRSGNYASWEHERWDDRITGNNCMNIIPTLFLSAEALGFKPQIIRFTGMYDIEQVQENQLPKEMGFSHYALRIDVGRKHDYLADPFYAQFGPILKEDENSMRVGNTNRSRQLKREFESVETVSPESFAAMMYRMKDPGESLDALVVGQKVHVAIKVGDSSGTQHIYYNDDDNVLKSRMYVWQTLLKDKAIIADQHLDDEGLTERTNFEFWYSRKCNWLDLVDGTKVADLRYSAAASLAMKLKPLINIRKYERLGPRIIEADRDTQRSLERIADKLREGMGEESMESLWPLVLARTLYEFTSPGKEFLFTDKQHESKIRKNRRDEIRRENVLRPINRLLWMHGWNLDKLDENQARKLRKIRRWWNDQFPGMITEQNGLNNMRKDRKLQFRRTMDQYLFGQRLEKKKLSPEEMADMVKRKRNAEPHIGYLAMVADFLPYFFASKNKVTLKDFMPSIREKVKARRLNHNSITQHETENSNSSQEKNRELAVVSV